MKKLGIPCLLICVAMIATWQCFAATTIPLTGAGLSGSASSHYLGIGDVLPGATSWYGLRGYNQVYAASGTNPAITVRRASDNTTSTINILPSGPAAIGTANAFAGIDATCTGTATSTTLILTACSSTPTAGDTLTSIGGTGSFTQPVYIASCGSFSGGAGNCTMNASQTVTGVTVTAQVALFVNKLFDQSGNGVHLTQSTTAKQPQLLPSCLNGFPCIYFKGSTQVLATPTACGPTGLPYFVSAVAERIGTTGSFTTIMNSCLDSATQTKNDSLSFANTPNTMNIYNGTALTATASDNNAHVISAFIPFFLNSTIYIDNTPTSGAAGGNWFSGIGTAVGNDNFDQSSGLNGYIFEVGNWQSPTTSNQANNICANDNAYWFKGSLPCTFVAPPSASYATVNGPCDLVTCAEAWSVTRALTTKYTGPLFQLYNGSTALDIVQVTSTRAADMTTWSAFCSGVQSNCSVSRIYAQINTTNNDLVAVDFAVAHSVCAAVGGSYTQCMSPFAIEVTTGLPVLNGTAALGKYSLNGGSPGAGGPGGAGNDQTSKGINGGTSGTTLVYNGELVSPVTATYCCGVFGMASQFNTSSYPLGGSFQIETFGDNNPAGNHPFCPFPTTASVTNFCLGLDAADTPGTEDHGDIGTSPLNVIAFMDLTNNPSLRVDLYYNGHTLFQHTPPLESDVNPPSSAYMRLGGGGDLSDPAPFIFREGFLVNSVVSTSNRSSILTNETSFYSGLSFP